MKKLLISLALVAVAATSAFAQITVGAGYVSANDFTKIGDTKTSASYGGFYVGADYQVVEFSGFDFTPGLYFNLNSRNENKITASETYINIPLNLGYKISLVPGTLAIKPFAAITPMVGITSTTSAGNTTHNSYESGKYKRIQLCVGGGLSLEIVDMIRVNVGYNYGFLNRMSSDNIKTNNSAVYFGVGYMF